MSKFKEVIKNPSFFLLWLGQIISQMGDKFGQMALIGFIPLDEPGSSMQLAKLLSFTILPVFLIGPVAGAYVDRWDRRRTMFISDFLRSGLVFLIPLFLLSRNTMIFIYPLIFIIFSIGRFFVLARFSIIPELVKKEELLISNSLINTTGMIATIAGFGIGGLIVKYWGVASGFYLDGLSFFISAVLVLFIRSTKIPRIKIKQLGLQIVEAINKSVIQEIKEGMSYFVKQKQVRFSAVIMFLLGGACGSVYILGIVFIRQTLKSVASDLGLLIMFLGLGFFAGSLIYGRFGQRLSHYKIIFSSLILSGIMLVVFALSLQQYPYFLIAAGLCFLMGLFVSPILIASNTIIHHASDSSMLGKTFSSLETAMHLGFLLFMFVSSLVRQGFYALALVVMGCVFSILGIISLIYHRRIPWLE